MAALVILHTWIPLKKNLPRGGNCPTIFSLKGSPTGLSRYRAGPDFLVVWCGKNNGGPLNYKNIKSQIGNRHDKQVVNRRSVDSGGVSRGCQRGTEVYSWADVREVVDWSSSPLGQRASLFLQLDRDVTPNNIDYKIYEIMGLFGYIKIIVIPRLLAPNYPTCLDA